MRSAIRAPRGEFRRFDGRIAVDFDHPDRSSVTFHALSRLGRIGLAVVRRLCALRGVPQRGRYPSIDFVSTSVEKIDDHTVRVSGDLTMLGVTRPLSVDVAVQRPKAAARAAARFHRENDDQPA